MPWKVGGNFEAAWMMCEANWKECAVAITNYLWCEAVRDVVDCLTDCLTREGVMWILAIAVTFALLLRVRQCKNAHREGSTVSKRILNRVGHKIQDLELKVNVLTYKMQYGTWPLPHQICNLNPKKLQKVRMTLSNPGDRKNWIKHMLLSPLESDTCAPYSNTFDSSVANLTNYFDVKRKDTQGHAQHNKLSTDCSSIETLKSASDQSVNARSRGSGVCARNANTRGRDLSRSDNFTLQRRNVQPLPSDRPSVNRRRSSKTFSTRNDGHHPTPSTSVQFNPCQEFTNTVHKCVSFLKEVKCNDESSRSLSYSSERSEGPSTSKNVGTTRQPILLTTEREKLPRDTREPVKGRGSSEMTKEIKHDEATENADEVDSRRSRVNMSSNAVVVMSNDVVSFPNRTAPIIPITQSAQNAASSRETLYEVRKRLQSLHNVLRTYEDGIKRDQVDEALVEALVSCVEPETISESRTVITNRDEDSTMEARPRTECTIANSCEYFELDRSGESSSSLAECSSNTSNKTYLCSSDVPASRNARSQGYDDRRVAAPRRPAPTARTDCTQCSSFFNGAMSRAIPEYEIRRVSGRELAISNPDEANVSSGLGKEDSETMSEKIRYVLSSADIRTFGETKKVDAKHSDTFDGERYRDNVIIISRNHSRSKMSKTGSDREEKSIALLLQEALHFKRALLTRLESEQKRRPVRGVKENTGVFADAESLSERETRIGSNDHFPSMILDINAEEPITSDHSRGRVNQRYVHVEMKRRRRRSNLLARRDSGGVTENRSLVPETPSEYFSISDLAIRDGDEVEGNAPLLLAEPPIYEKVISITIPVNVDEEEGAIDENERSVRAETILGNLRTARAKSRRDMSENASDIGDATASSDVKCPPMLKLEDLILERVKNIRDYMDTFLQSQNRAITDARRALRCRDEGENAFRRSNQASRERLTASSSCNSVDRAAKASSRHSRRPDFRTNDTRTNCKSEAFVEDDILKRCCERRLKRNPGMFTLVAPMSGTFFDKNDARWSEAAAATTLEKRETDVLLKYSRDKTTNSANTPSCKERECVTSTTERDKISEQMMANINANFQKCGGQAEIDDIESKFSATSYFPLDTPQDHAQMTMTTTMTTTRCDEHADRSRYNSITRTSSYFTDEAASSVKIDNTPSKSTSSVAHSRAKSDAEKEIKKNNISGQQISVDKRSDAIVAMPSKPSSNVEYSDSTFVDSNLITEKSESRSHDRRPIDAEASLQENNIIQEPAETSLPFSLDLKEKNTPNTDDDSFNDIKRYECSDEMSANDAYSPARKECHSAKRSCQAYSRIKAKSDMSLVTNATKDFDLDLRPKRSHSLFMPHETLEHIRNISSTVKLRRGKDKCTEDEGELQSATRSRSVIPPQRVPTKSCIPILKSHLEAARRMTKRQTRSPIRSPLTMLWRDKTCTKNLSATEEGATRESNVPANERLFVEEAALNFAKLNTENALVKELETNTETYRDSSSITSKDNSELLSSDRNVGPLQVNKEYADKKLVCGSKSDTRIMKRIDNSAPKAVAIISIVTNDDLRKNYPANTFILKTGNVCSATDLLKQTKGLWTITVEKTEKEVTAKPSITDTCTSMSDLH